MKMSDLGKASDLKLPDGATELEDYGVDVEQLMLYGLTQLPDYPIAIGESWQGKQIAPLAKVVDEDGDSVMAYKLLAVDGRSITVGQKLLVDPDKQNPPGGVKPEDLSVTGTAKLDLRTGTPIEATMRMKSKFGGLMKMTMDVKQTIKPAPVASKPAPKKK
jgi:hypothetical protein